MRNYRFESDLRRDECDEEPELQWLENSINYLAALTFVCVRELCKAAFLLVHAVFRAFVKTKCD